MTPVGESSQDPFSRQDKLERMKSAEAYGEKAYDDLYEKAHSPSDARMYYSDAKEGFYDAIKYARELGLEEDVKRLEARLAHIKAVFRSQFS